MCSSYAAAIDTGLRAGELAALEWSDVDFERHVVRYYARCPSRARGQP